MKHRFDQLELRFQIRIDLFSVCLVFRISLFSESLGLAVKRGDCGKTFKL